MELWTVYYPFALTYSHIIDEALNADPENGWIDLAVNKWWPM